MKRQANTKTAPDALPVAFVFSAVDGTGGAGAFADCRAFHRLHCLPIAIISAVTAQNLDGVNACWPLSRARLEAQLDAFAHLTPAVVKIGALGHAAPVISRWLRTLDAAVPVVWDPVFAPTRGAHFLSAKAQRKLPKNFLRQITLATPNRRELLEFSGESRLQPAVRHWLAQGVHHVLVTDVRGKGATVESALFAAAPGSKTRTLWEARCDRRPGQFHGSGCRLSSAIAARLACGLPLTDAITRAQTETEAALDCARTLPALGEQKLII